MHRAVQGTICGIQVFCLQRKQRVWLCGGESCCCWLLTDTISATQHCTGFCVLRGNKRDLVLSPLAVAFSLSCHFWVLTLNPLASPLHCLWLQLFPSPPGKDELKYTNTPCSLVLGLMRKVAGAREAWLDDSSKPWRSLGHFDTSSLRLLFASSCSRPALS